MNGAVRRARPRRRDGGFQNAEALALVLRFHALAQLGLLVALEQRLILLFRGLLIARQERELLLAVGHALQAPLRPSRIVCTECRSRRLQLLELGVQARDRWRRLRPPARRPFRWLRAGGRGIPSSSGSVAASSFDACDLVLEPPHVGMLVG